MTQRLVAVVMKLISPMMLQRGQKDGGSGSVISFDPKDPGTDAVNTDGTKSRPV